MRKLLAIFISVILITLLGISASAHRGKTDSNGGHYDRSTGEYHYHHGYPAHQHTNGECPYAFDDKTNHNGGGTSTSSKSSTTSSNKVKEEKDGISVAGWIAIIILFLPVALAILSSLLGICLELLSKIKEKWKNRRILSKRERIDLFLFWLRIFSFVASIVGIVFFFIKPIITLFCSIVTVLLSIFDCIWGEQTNFNTEIATIIIAIVICCFTHTPIFYGIGFALCITEFLFTLIGYISLWVKLRKK